MSFALRTTWFVVSLAACGRFHFDVNDVGFEPDAAVIDGVTSTFEVGCPNTTRTADELCQIGGYSYAAAAHGYYWFQCGGTLDRCPGGWQFDGLTCPNWCSGTDCVGVPFCGPGPNVIERVGGGSTPFAPLDFGSNCTGYNRGWTVRALCVR